MENKVCLKFSFGCTKLNTLGTLWLLLTNKNVAMNNFTEKIEKKWFKFEDKITLEIHCIS